MSRANFSDWYTWQSSPYFDKLSFYETFDGGQSFAWSHSNSFIEGTILEHCFRLKLRGNKIIFSIPKSSNPDKAQAVLANYLATDLDFEAMRDRLPWRSDPILRHAIEAFPYLRILRQPLPEALFGFLCSSSKQITQIKEILRLSARHYGKALSADQFTLPSWEQLGQIGEKNLRALKLGYRARYIQQTAEFIQAHPAWLEKLSGLDTNQAKTELTRLPGVGEKIADCVALFALTKMDAFPIDTWIEKILTRAYGLQGYNKAQLTQFARVHFGPDAGYAQQFLFAAARAQIISL